EGLSPLKSHCHLQSSPHYIDSAMVPLFAIVSVIAFLPSVTWATDASCINVTLPNILGIGKCLGNSLDFCSTGNNSLVQGVVKLVTCLVGGVVTNGSPLAVLATIRDLLAVVLQKLGLSNTLLNLLPPLCSIVQITGCQNIITAGNMSCETPITINLPSTLNIGKCLDQTVMLCEQGKPATDNLVAGLLKFVRCLLSSITGTPLNELLNGLVCGLVKILGNLLGDLPLLGNVVKSLITNLGKAV
ncbi:unnamed protein product, partial [Ixodes persulcatus]